MASPVDVQPEAPARTCPACLPLDVQIGDFDGTDGAVSTAVHVALTGLPCPFGHESQVRLTVRDSGLHVHRSPMAPRELQDTPDIDAYLTAAWCSLCRLRPRRIARIGGWELAWAPVELGGTMVLYPAAGHGRVWALGSDARMLLTRAVDDWVQAGAPGQYVTLDAYTDGHFRVVVTMSTPLPSTPPLPSA